MIDDFERAGPGLGANWTQTDFAGGANLIVGSSDFSAAGGAGMSFWNANTPASATYVCAKLSGAGSAGSAGVCLGVDNVAGGNGVCCDAFGGAPSPWAMQSIHNGGASTADTDTTPTFVTTNWIGIQRMSGTSFRCYRSTDGTTWTAIGIGATLSPPNPGRWGAYATSETGVFTLEVWEAGNGTLPTSRVCGSP